MLHLSIIRVCPRGAVKPSCPLPKFRWQVTADLSKADKHVYNLDGFELDANSSFKSVISSFAVRAFPTYMVIDGDGIIKQVITGMNPQETVVHRLKATLQAMPELETAASK